ncbi:hypothetical protein GCM10018954_088440 [Kutzneria kofuensis]
MIPVSRQSRNTELRTTGRPPVWVAMPCSESLTTVPSTEPVDCSTNDTPTECESVMWQSWTTSCACLSA